MGAGQGLDHEVSIEYLSKILTIFRCGYCAAFCFSRVIRKSLSTYTWRNCSGKHTVTAHKQQGVSWQGLDYPSLVHFVQNDVRQLLQTAPILQPSQQHPCRETQ